MLLVCSRMRELSIGLYRGRTNKELFISENDFDCTRVRKDKFDWLNFSEWMMNARMVELYSSYPKN